MDRATPVLRRDRNLLLPETRNRVAAAGGNEFRLLHSLPLVLAIAAVWVMCLPEPAFAYVDPSVMTYTIQALAGVAVALSAVLGVAFRRSRRAIMKLLRIDEDAGKVRDPHVERIDPDTPEGRSALAKADDAARRMLALEDADAKKPARSRNASHARNVVHPRKPARSRKAERMLSWPQRLWRSLLVSLLLAGNVFVYAPLGIVAAGGSSLVFTFSEVAPLVFLFGAAVTAALALLISVFRGRAFHIVLALVFALGVCCYMQGMFLNTSLPLADGTPLDLSGHMDMVAFSSLAWIVSIAAFVTLAFKKTKVMAAFAIVLSAGLVVVQGAGLASMAVDSAGTVAKNDLPNFVTREGINTLSSGDNIVVFALDTFDISTVNDMLQEYPGAFDEFTGFTFYDNTTAAMVPTRYGVSVLLTGRMPEGGDQVMEFVEKWYPESDLLPGLKRSGYSLGVYSDSLTWGGKDFAAQFADNIHPKESRDFDQEGTLSIIARMGLYADLPWALKPPFWYTTDDINNCYVVKATPDQEDYEKVSEYVTQDGVYSRDLHEEGLSLDGDGKTFRFIHLLGPHNPWTLGADGVDAGAETSLMEQARGSVQIVADYLAEMKRLGVYDNSTIIVTTDHGLWNIIPANEDLGYADTGLLMVKPSEDAEEAAAPMKVSSAPVSLVDVASTIAAVAGFDGDFDGVSVFDVPEGDQRERRFWSTKSNGKRDLLWEEYAIDGFAQDYDNWSKTGNVIIIPEELDAH